MNDELENTLTEEITKELHDLESLETGSREKHNAIEDVAKLYELLLETKKLENDKERNDKQYEVDTKKLENDKERNDKQYEVDTKKLENDKERNENQYEVDTKKLENDKERNENQYEVDKKKLENDKERNENQYEVDKKKLENDECRNKNQYEVDKKKLENDKECDDKQLSESKKDRYIKIGITAAEIIVAVAFNSFWMAKGFKFEETGCFTSGVFKEFRSHNKFFKK